MNKNEAEVVIRDTIEYANREIEKHKRKTRRGIAATVGAVIVLCMAYLLVFKVETVVKYNEQLISVNVPEDQGLDININLNNYKAAKGVLVKTSEDTYDLYMGVTQTLFSKMTTGEANLLRVGNGIIVDYNSEKIIGFMPGNSSAESIEHVYYIEDTSDKVLAMDDSDLMKYEKKTLVWTR